MYYLLAIIVLNMLISLDKCHKKIVVYQLYIIYKWCRVSCGYEITLSQLYHYRNITRKLQTVKYKDQWSFDCFSIDIVNYYYSVAINNLIIFPIIFLIVSNCWFFHLKPTPNLCISRRLKLFRSFRALRLDTLARNRYTKTLHKNVTLQKHTLSYLNHSSRNPSYLRDEGWSNESNWIWGKWNKVRAI